MKLELFIKEQRDTFTNLCPRKFSALECFIICVLSLFYILFSSYIFIYLPTTQSCNEKINSIETFNNGNFIINSLPDSQGVIVFEVNGFDYLKNKNIIYRNDDRVIQTTFGKLTEIGDTFIKENNSNTYILAKKNRRLLLEYRCKDDELLILEYVDSTSSLNHIPSQYNQTSSI